jgi:hypothetical protein
MRTARPFIASIPLAIILVAALVVPLAVIPGTFGFDSWPSSHGAAISERQVLLPAPKVDVVAVRPRKPSSQRHPVFVAARPHAASPMRTTVALTPHRAPVVRVSAPAPKPDPVRHHVAPQPAQPQPHEQQPQTAPPAQPQPQPQPTSNQLADGNGPVAREQAPQEPQPAPAPAPPPVAQAVPAPVERAVPSEPCHGRGGGEHGDGNSGD